MMSRPLHHRVCTTVAAISTIALFAGCENSIEPFAETTRHFAVFGFLDADADTQFVRIEATRPEPDAEGSPGTAARVTTTDLVNSQSIEWRDSTIVLDDGGFGLLYWAAFRPVPGRAYRIEVEREDGAASHATTVVPLVGNLDTRRPTRTSTGTLEQSLIFDAVRRRPERVTMNYSVGLEPGRDPLLITLEYNVFGVPAQSGWRISVRLTRDKERIHSRLALAPSTQLVLHDVSMTVRLLSNDWPPFDSNERITNVVDGFGFFGSAATQEVHWQVDSLTVRQLGFVDDQAGQSQGG